MNLESFRNSIKVQSVDDYLQYIVDTYVQSAQTFNTNNGANLREMFRKDPSSAGEYDKKDHANFFNKKLVADLMIHKGIYQDYLADTKEGQKNTYSVFAQEIVKAITPFKGYVLLDSSRLRGGNPQVNLEHEFSLNVDAQNIYKVVRNIYETAVTNNIDFFITIPNVVDRVEGYNDFISIICETENLESTLRLLDLIPAEIKAMCKRPCPLGASIDNWVGYVSVENNQDISNIIGISIIQGIDTAIREFANGQPDVMQYVNALDSGVDKDQVRVQALKIMSELNPQAYQSIVSYIKVALNANNIDLDNLFLAKGIAEKLGFTNTVVEPVTEVAQVNELPVSTAETNEPPIVQAVVEPNMEVAAPVLETALPVEAPVVAEVASPVSEVPVANVAPSGQALPADVIIENVPEMPSAPVTDVVPAQDFDPNLIPAAANVQAVSEIAVPEDSFVSVPQANEVFDVAQAVEAQAVASQVTVNDANRAIYAQIGLTDEQLNTVVKDQNGAQVTLFEFLESNETLKKVPVDADVTLIMDTNNTQQDQVMKGSSFIVNMIVPYALRIGDLSVDGIVEKYAKEIKQEAEKKKSLFGGLFKKK